MAKISLHFILKLSTFKKVILNKTDIFLLSEIKINEHVTNLHLFGGRLNDAPKKTAQKNGGGFSLYVKENIPSKLVYGNYFTKLLLGLYKTPTQYDLSFLYKAKI